MKPKDYMGQSVTAEGGGRYSIADINAFPMSSYAPRGQTEMVLSYDLSIRIAGHSFAGIGNHDRWPRLFKMYVSLFLHLRVHPTRVFLEENCFADNETFICSGGSSGSLSVRRFREDSPCWLELRYKFQVAA